ncbi:MAG: hypothetical protein RR709_00860, partial [Ruthenibacterium sp.]
WAVYVLEKRSMSFFIVSAMLITGTLIADFCCPICPHEFCESFSILGLDFLFADSYNIIICDKNR